MTGKRVLDRLMSELPLAPHWMPPEVHAETVLISGVTFHLVGLSTTQNQVEVVCGSAAATDDFPYERAYFELLERTSTVDAMTRGDDELARVDEAGDEVGTCSASVAFPQSPPGVSWRYARSNGVAAHRSWKQACAAARRELVERDRVLQCWFGASRPSVMRAPPALVPPSLHAEYDVVACALGSATPDAVGAVFAFPRISNRPLACGFSAGVTLDVALRAAARECMQSLAFLWGEPLPFEPPPASADPAFHQEFYLFPPHHSRLRAWLAGAHVQTVAGFASLPSAAYEYVDLTPDHLRNRMRVAKALPRGELPLTFGPGHPSVTGEMPPDLAVHPIT